MQALEYPSYLKTSHWKKKKTELYNYRNATCQDCGVRSLYENSFDGHHLHYKTLWKENVKTDLALLCNETMNGCHYRRHRRKSILTIKPSDILFWLGNFFQDLIESYAID